MKTMKQKQSGLSLIELMISIAVGLLLLAGVVTIYSNSVISNSNSMRTAKLNQDMRAIMLMMVNDIRRAGYSGATAAAAGIGAGPGTNPFRTINTATPGCILFNYDLNENSTVDNATEDFGYRLSDGMVQSRPAGGTCGAGAWQTLSDDRTITITALTFTPRMGVSSVDTNGDGVIDIWIGVRTYDIAMSARLTNDASVTYTLTESVRVRNDLLSATALIAIP